MKDVRLPQMALRTKKLNWEKIETIDEQQINKSSIFSYLGIKGNGNTKNENNKYNHSDIERLYNAIPLLGYVDIYKNYYANLQEEKGYIVNGFPEKNKWHYISISNSDGLYSSYNENKIVQPRIKNQYIQLSTLPTIKIEFNQNTTEEEILSTKLKHSTVVVKLIDLGVDYKLNGKTLEVKVDSTKIPSSPVKIEEIYFDAEIIETEPKLGSFDISEIDEMRESLMNKKIKYVDLGTGAPGGTVGTTVSKAPINLMNKHRTDYIYSCQSTMNGLLVKTYQSDLFNNWVNTELIDGDNGINAITAVDISDDKLNLDSLNLAQKVYNMLQRISVSGGTYEDWVQVVYDHKMVNRSTTPVYQGGLSKEIVFQEIVSTMEDEKNPLGTLAGRGVQSSKHKGGYIKIKCDEPSYIMGIVSITPRVDYSQGNEWDVNLKNMDELHKPSLDGIGYQDLITEQMSFVDYIQEIQNGNSTGKETRFSAGKQPAWINYMTNYDKSFGNFAEKNNQMFMTLNRNYEYKTTENNTLGQIKDITTYIDPKKYNYAFADISRSAQNFWLQIACDITARRKMSAKQIPNL